MQRFIFGSLTATLLLALITWLGSQQGIWILPTYWIEILFFVLFSTLVIYYNLFKLRSKQSDLFTLFYLFSIVLKMVGGLTFIFFVVWDEPFAAIGNVTLFIVCYLILTFLEVFFLLRRSSN